MHPDVEKIQPGICPVCGMNLIVSRKTKGEGQMHNDKHAGHNITMFGRKFWVSLALTIPVVLYSELPERLLGWSAPAFPGSGYLPAVLASAVFFYGGWVFLAGAWRELRGWLPGMMTLIGIAISVAYVYSVYVTVMGVEGALYWELTTLITIMLLGHWMEMKAVSGAQGALRELSKLLPDTAEVMRGGRTGSVPLAELQEGDIVLVRPGGKVPADGVVSDGRSEVNEAMITGESQPVAKTAGSAVIAGTINGDGPLTVRVSKIGEHTFLAGIQRLIAEAQASKSRLQLLSDRAAFYLTIIAVVGGLLTLVLWLWAGRGTAFAIERLVAVLVIACPHALGLAIPLVATISTTLAARSGFLVRERRALETARNVDVVLFDKTGTLTKGEYGVERIWSMTAKDEREVLALAASVDAPSEHFIARAIVVKARQDGLSLSEVKNFQAIAGKGARGLVNGEEVLVGGAAILADRRVPEAWKPELEAEAQRGRTVVFVLRGGELFGAIALGDVIRPESREAIRSLRDAGIKTAMITGDSEDVAAWVSRELKIEEYFARVLPQDKAVKVRLLQERGMKVAMVGDGINDAPALAQADVGIAVGAGTNVAIESAGIILVRNDPGDIPKIIRLSRLTYTKMLQNLFWATGYNIIALPLAAGALASYGIFLQPAASAFLMSFSTVIVALNALLLRRQVLV